MAAALPSKGIVTIVPFADDRVVTTRVHDGKEAERGMLQAGCSRGSSRSAVRFRKASCKTPYAGCRRWWLAMCDAARQRAEVPVISGSRIDEEDEGLAKVNAAQLPSSHIAKACFAS